MMKKLILLACVLCGIGAAAAEKHTYSLALNWKFVWINAGNACLQTENIEYNGTDALRTTLTASTNPSTDKIYKLKDTLVSITDRAGNPLLFKKNCIEGDDVVDERAVFSRTSAGHWRVMQRKVKKDGSVIENDTTCTAPVFDMVSLMMQAKEMDLSSMSFGQRSEVLMVGSRRVYRQSLVYGGLIDLALKNDDVRRCHVFTIVKPDKAGLDKEVLRFYVSDDAQRTPLQIDFFLKFGTAKARLEE